MRAEQPLPSDLDRRIDALAAAWAADRDVAATWLFGSRARGTAAATSDVDLAVVLREGLGPAERFRKRLDLVGDACSRLGTDAVDVIVVEDSPSLLVHRMLRDGRLLAEPDPARRVAACEDALRRYFDEAPIRAELDRALAERVKEGRFGR